MLNSSKFYNYQERFAAYGVTTLLVKRSCREEAVALDKIVAPIAAIVCYCAWLLTLFAHFLYANSRRQHLEQFTNSARLPYTLLHRM